MIIYLIKNKINGKLYVGQTTVSLAVRWAGHVMSTVHGNPCVLYKAMRKYGISSFSIKAIDKASSRKVLDKKEAYWIKKLKTMLPDGYNMRPTASGVLMTPEVRAKIREKATGRKMHVNTAAALLKANKGRKWSTASKARLSKKKLGVAQPNNCGILNGNYGGKHGFKGRKHSAATKLKMRQAALANKENRARAARIGNLLRYGKPAAGIQ